MGEISANNAYLGMNLNSVISQVKPGQVTYALNAQAAGFDGNSITYQNEQANKKCFDFPAGFKVIGTHNIVEKKIVIYYLVNPSTGESEIGKVVNQSCTYQTIINAPCLNFNINNPIHKTVHRITNCDIEIYWADGLNPRRYLKLGDLPFKQVVQGTNQDPCNVVTTSEIDCNKLNVQPDFSIPHLDYDVVSSEGSTLAGTYQFAFQYSSSLGDAYTSYYSVTNPIPINDPFKVTLDFNYLVGKSITLNISNIDTTGIYDYFNIAVIKTVNNISSVDLVGTFQIQGATQKIIYTGQSKANITLSINDIFEKFPVYDVADSVTVLQDILVWKGLTTTQRLSYQDIASKLELQWVTWKMPPQRKQYKDEINSAELRGYMRDELYAFDIVFILKNGYQTDRFPLIGREATESDLSIVDNNDSDFGTNVCDASPIKRRWEVYNTASITAFDPEYLANQDDPCYQGPYQFGKFAYWESTETYPCNDQVWGSLQGKKIRHHKFPDSSITHHHDSTGNVYPIGVRVDKQQLWQLIQNSSLTQDEKDNIADIKIVRANTANQQSIKAKGILYNVGQYSKDNSSYFYPNYPFNDLRPDPFILNVSNNSAGATIINRFQDVASQPNQETILYEDEIAANTLVNDNDVLTFRYSGRFGSPNVLPPKRFRFVFGGVELFNIGNLNVNSQNSWNITIAVKKIGPDTVSTTGKLVIQGSISQTHNDNRGATASFNFANPIQASLRAIVNDFGLDKAIEGDIVGSSVTISFLAASQSGTPFLDGFSTPNSRNRFTFHSPDTSFYQPFLGNILKLESVEYGQSKAHFVQVKEHARYRFPSLNSYLTSLAVGVGVGFFSATIGISTNIFNGSAAFTAFTVFNDIIFKLLPKKNMAYQFNSLGNYTTPVPLPNDTGNKIRQIDIASYLISGMQGVGDINVVNNYQRESSVYIRTVEPLPFPSTVAGVPQDNSRYILGDEGCDTSFKFKDISSYYGSIKNIIPDQYGQIYSYDAIDTGFQISIDVTVPFSGQRYFDVFGGDTFINKFAFKRKLPFFVDNRVRFPDESDVFYDELSNIGFTRFWFSTDVTQGDGGFFNVGSLFGVKVNNFDCKEGKFFYDSGKIYLFAYSIVNFFAESRVNVDYRQAYNAQEGDYWPHVSGDVPDDWFQEVNVPIAFDNSYTYNKTYSKQNIENTFTTLPVDFVPGLDCTQNFPNKAIYSDRQEDIVNYTRNNWLIYRPVAFYDFPLAYGRLISLDAIETRQLLARFESRSQLYNALLTTQSSQGDVYLGQSIFNRNIPPIDFSSTDLGYGGSQHKFMLSTEYGHLYVDAERGQVMLFKGNQMDDLGGEELQYFFTDNLPFKIKEAFPDYDVDNNFKGVGLHGVFDTKYNRILLTKLDYKPLNSSILYDKSTDTFTLNGTEIELTDTRYFCNQSFTLSYWFASKSWISFHTYLPNFYVGEINMFQNGSNVLNSSWLHNTVIDQYNTFYGVLEPYIVEEPYSFKTQDMTLQCIKDYSKVNKIIDSQRFVQTEDIFFNKAIVYNDQQNSGILDLVHKPKNNLSAYLTYPIYNADSKSVLFVKSNNFYNYNGFWDIVKDYENPIWLENCSSLSFDKTLNIANLDYSQRSFKKYLITAKDCKVRHILDNRGDVRITSQFILIESQVSYK